MKKRKFEEKVVHSPKKKLKKEESTTLVENQTGQSNYGSYVVKTMFEMMGDEKTWNSTLKLFHMNNIDDFNIITKDKIEKCAEYLKGLYIALKTENSEEVQTLTTNFYNELPHISSPPIDTVKKVNDKITLLGILHSIQLIQSHKLLAFKQRSNFVKSSIDSLKLNFCPLAKGDLYKTLELLFFYSIIYLSNIIYKIIDKIIYI